MGVVIVSKTLLESPGLKCYYSGKEGSEFFFLIPCRNFKHLPFECKSSLRKNLTSPLCNPESNNSHHFMTSVIT